MSEYDININTDTKEACLMIVDDDESNVRLLHKLLNMSGYKNVVCTQDPTKVLEMYQETNSDLILLDLDMPRLDGYGVMVQLNELTNDNPPPILVLTAQHMQSYRQRALDNGALDYVTKPFDADELLSRVRNLLQLRMAQKFMQHQTEILEQKVEERTRELNVTRLQVVHCLGRAAEYRDEETGLHIIRMSQIAAVLGKAAGLDSEQCELLLNATPMHDIGKIGIPDQILLKPGKLEPDEWKIMKTHAQIGADILAVGDSDLMRMAHDIALSHHEKYDGSGYPNGLVGEEIPLAGRITALADVFDALTSERPYKKAFPVSQAVEMITEQRGKHFDPELVDLFMEKLPEIVAIRDKYAEPAVDNDD